MKFLWASLQSDVACVSHLSLHASLVTLWFVDNEYSIDMILFLEEKATQNSTVIVFYSAKGLSNVFCLRISILMFDHLTNGWFPTEKRILNDGSTCRVLILTLVLAKSLRVKQNCYFCKTRAFSYSVSCKYNGTEIGKSNYKVVK